MPCKRPAAAPVGNPMALQIHRSTAVLENAQCPICFDTFQDPVLLSDCAHTFCRRCVLPMTESYGPPPRCPSCRKPFRRNSVLPNYALAALLRDMGRSSAAPPGGADSPSAAPAGGAAAEGHESGAQGGPPAAGAAAPTAAAEPDGTAGAVSTRSDLLSFAARMYDVVHQPPLPPPPEQPLGRQRSSVQEAACGQQPLKRQRREPPVDPTAAGQGLRPPSFFKGVGKGSLGDDVRTEKKAPPEKVAREDARVQEIPLPIKKSDAQIALIIANTEHYRPFPATWDGNVDSLKKGMSVLWKGIKLTSSTVERRE